MEKKLSFGFLVIFTAASFTFPAHGMQPPAKKRKALATESIDESNKVLLRSAFTGNIGKIQEALNAGADINTENNYGQTALMIATQQGHEDIVRLLVNRGAQVNNNPAVIAILARPMATMMAAKRQRHPLIGLLPNELLYLIEEYVIAPSNQ